MILSGKEAADFMTWLTKKVNILAVVDLPDDLFANMKYPKSILVLQNHGQKMQLRKVLVTKLGSLKDKSSLVKLNVELNNWVNE
jgi:site-specific DNA-methyltransferase (adenine-specific)